MRHERTTIGDEESAGYTFFFQIANDGRRRACCVQVDALSIHEASALFQQKWSIIERMARDSMKTSVSDDGVIKLAVP
jgi:hypothetical protein